MLFFKYWRYFISTYRVSLCFKVTEWYIGSENIHFSFCLHTSASIQMFQKSAPLQNSSFKCLNPRMNTHIHKLTDTHCYSTRLQMNSAPSLVFQQQQTSISILQKAPPDFFQYSTLSVFWKGCGRAVVTENFSIFSDGKSCHGVITRFTSWKKQKPVGRMNWGDVQSEGDVWIPVGRVCPREVKLVPSGLRGTRVGVRPHCRELFPLRSQRDSSASHCSTKTREGEGTIVSDRQTIFSTQWELRAVKTAQRCVLKNLSCSGRIMAPTSGGEYQFHTSESSSQRKYSHWCSERDRVPKIKLRNGTH